MYLNGSLRGFQVWPKCLLTLICAQEHCVREIKGESDKTCCRNGPSLNAMLYVFAGICGVQTEAQSHRNTHTPHLQACVWTCRTAGQRRHTPPPALKVRGHRVGQNGGSITPELQVRLNNNPPLCAVTPSHYRHTWTWTIHTLLFFQTITEAGEPVCVEAWKGAQRYFYKCAVKKEVLVSSSQNISFFTCAPSRLLSSPSHSPASCPLLYNIWSNLLDSSVLADKTQGGHLCNLYFNSFVHAFFLSL